MKENIKLSVIITSYNIEEYIADTIDSILRNVANEDRNKIEIIITDDKSSDNTVVEIKKAMKKNNFDNYELNINEKNYKYPGKGLNYGLEKAVGKYIHIVDGDDIVNSEIYKHFFDNEVEEDIIEFSTLYFNKDIEKVFKLEGINKEFQDKYPYEETVRTFGNEIRSYSYWNKIYKKSLLEGIKFQEDRSAQDLAFNVEVFKKKPIICFKRAILLNYRCGLDSISTRLHTRKLEENIMSAKEKLAIFPKHQNKEHIYLVNLLLHSNPDELEQNIQIYEKYGIFSDENSLDDLIAERPTHKIADRWIEYLLYVALKEKNYDDVKMIINNKLIQKKIIKNWDRKVEGFLTPISIKNLLLLRVFLSKEEYQMCYEKEVEYFKFKIDIRELFYNKKDVNYSELLKLLEEVLKNYSEEDLEKFIKKERLPRNIKTVNQILKFYKSYIDEINPIKYSIVMTSYNREEYIFDAIQSFLNNNYKQAELIIVDNHSNERLKNKIKKFIFEKKQIKLIEKNHNYFCGGRNYGIKIAQGSYISFMDDDDILAENYFTELDKYLIDNSFDLVRFNAIYVDKQKKFIPQMHFSIVNHVEIKNSDLNLSPYKTYKKYVDEFPSAALGIINIRLLKEKPFVENIYFEDIAFYNEMILTGRKILKIIEPLYIRRIHDESIMGKINGNQRINEDDYFNSPYKTVLAIIINIAFYQKLNEEIINFSLELYNFRVEKFKKGREAIHEKRIQFIKSLINEDSIDEILEKEETLNETEKFDLYKKYQSNKI